MKKKCSVLLCVTGALSEAFLVNASLLVVMLVNTNGGTGDVDSDGICWR